MRRDPGALIRRAATATFRATVFAAPWAAGLALVQAVATWAILRNFAFDARSAASNFSPVSFFQRDVSWWSWLQQASSDTFGESFDRLGTYVVTTLVILTFAAIWMQSLMAAAVVDRGFTRRWLPRVMVRAIGRAPALAVAWAPAMVVLGGPWWLSARLDRAGNTAGSALAMLPILPIMYFVVPPLLLVPAKVVTSNSSFLRWPVDGIVESWRAVSGQRLQAWLVVMIGGGIVIGPVIAVCWLFALASILMIPIATGVVIGGTALACGGLAAAGAAVHDEFW